MYIFSFLFFLSFFYTGGVKALVRLFTVSKLYICNTGFIWKMYATVQQVEAVLKVELALAEEYIFRPSHTQWRQWLKSDNCDVKTDYYSQIDVDKQAHVHARFTCTYLPSRPKNKSKRKINNKLRRFPFRDVRLSPFPVWWLILSVYVSQHKRSPPNYQTNKNKTTQLALKRSNGFSLSSRPGLKCRSL